MALSVVTHVSAGDDDAQQTIVLPSVATQAGDLMVIGVHWNYTGATTISSIANTTTNTFQEVNASETDFSDLSTRMQIWYGQNLSAHATNVTTVTFVGTPAFTWASAFLIRGAVTSGALDDEVGVAIAAGSPHVSGSYTTTQAHTIGCYFVSHANVVNDYAVGSGYTAGSLTLGNGTYNYGASQYRIFSSVQTGQTAQMTSSNTTDIGAVVWAGFKGIAGGSGGLVGPSVLVSGPLGPRSVLVR